MGKPDEVKTKEITIGLIGCGDHAQENLIPVIMRSPGVKCKWVADPDQNAARRAALLLPNAILAPSWENGVAEHKPHALIVAATPQIHEKVAAKCIDENIALFVEKPPTVDRQNLARLSAASELSRQVTMVGHNLRFAEASLELRRASADLGPPTALEMRYLGSKPRGDRWNLGNPTLSFLLSHVTHAVDLMIFHMGHIDEVLASRIVQKGNTLTLGLQVRFGNGAVGSLIATNGAPYFDIGVTIVGSDGALAKMDGLKKLTVATSDRDPKRWQRTWVSPTLNTGHSLAGYEGELAMFMEAIRSRDPSLASPNLTQELAVYEVVEKIYGAVRQ